VARVQHNMDNELSGGDKEMTNNARVRRPVISIQVINMTCSCGADCVNERGSIMIEHFGRLVWCQECGEQYEVPATIFNKQLKA